MIYVVATLKIKPGTRDACLAAAKPCITETLKEPGCISYDLFSSSTEPESLVFVERWKTREDLTTHSKTPHIKAWRDAGSPYILERKIEIIHPDKVEAM